MLSAAVCYREREKEQRFLLALIGAVQKYDDPGAGTVAAGGKPAAAGVFNRRPPARGVHPVPPVGECGWVSHCGK